MAIVLAALPTLVPALAAGAAAAYTGYQLVQQGVVNQVVNAVQSLRDSIQGSASRQQQQAAVSDTVTQRQNLTLLSQNQAVANQTLTFQQRAAALQEYASNLSQKAAAAQAVDQVVSTSGSAAEVKARAAAILSTAELEQKWATSKTEEAVRAWEDAQAKAKEAEAAAEANAQGVVSAVAALAGTAIPEIGAVPMSGAISAAGLAALIPTMAKEFAKTSHTQTLSCMASTGSKMIEALSGALLPAGIMAGVAAFPQLQGPLQWIAKQAIDTLYGPLERAAPITPDKAPSVGLNLLMQAIFLGSQAHLLSVTAEAYTPLKNMGLGYLSAFLTDMAGFSRIAAAFQGMTLQWGLTQPMRYWALQKFQPMIPREQDLIRLLGEHAITRDQFNQYMPYHGYPQEWIDKLYELADRPLSPMLFRYLGEAGLLDSNLIDRELKNASYHPETIPYLKTWLERVAAGETKGLYGSVVSKVYRAGRLEDLELLAHLGNLGYSDRQQERALYSARLDLANELADDCRLLFEDQFKSGLIEADDLDLRLTVLGYIPARRQVNIARAALKRKPKKEAKVDPKVEAEMRKLQAKYVEAYIKLYHMGELTLGDLKLAIVSTGVSEELADITANLEYLKQAAEAEKVGAKEAATFAAETQRKYDALAKSSAAEQSKEKAAELKLAEATILTLYRKGLATVEELGQVLLSLGMPAGQVSGTIALETAKLLPSATAGET